jgi:hypothetical protein
MRGREIEARPETTCGAAILYFQPDAFWLTVSAPIVGPGAQVGSVPCVLLSPSRDLTVSGWGRRRSNSRAFTHYVRSVTT